MCTNVNYGDDGSLEIYLGVSGPKPKVSEWFLHSSLPLLAASVEPQIHL